MQTIQLELSPAIEAKLDEILRLLEQMSGIPTPATQPEPIAEDKLFDSKLDQVVKLPEATEPVQQTYTIADVRQAVVRLSAAGKKVEVRDIVKAYAEKVPDIPADKVDEVMVKLNALGVSE